MLDAVLVAEPVEDVVEGVFVMRHVGELDAIVGQHGVDGLRHGSDHIAQELGGEHPACFQLQFHKGELAGPVDGQEQA